MKYIAFLLFFLSFFAKAQNCVSIKNSITGKTNKTGAVFFSANRTADEPIMTFLKDRDGFKINCLTPIATDSLEGFFPEKICLFAKCANGIIKQIPGSKYSTIGHDNSGTTISFVSSTLGDDMIYFKSNPIVTLSFSLTDISKSFKHIEVNTDIAERIEQTVACVTEK